MKKNILLSSIIALSMFIVSNNHVQVKATSNENYSASTDTNSEYEEISLQEALKNPKNYPNLEVQIYDAEEFIEIIKVDDNMSLDEKVEMIKYVELTEEKENIISTYATSYYTTKYVTFTENAYVTSTYSCRPYFYTQCNALNGVPVSIAKILNGNVDLNYNGVVKVFSGTLYYNLENSNTIYWDLNGHFYNKGTITASGGGSVPVGGSATLNFSVSASSNYYAYTHKSGRRYLV